MGKLKIGDRVLAKVRRIEGATGTVEGRIIAILSGRKIVEIRATRLGEPWSMWVDTEDVTRHSPFRSFKRWMRVLAWALLFGIVFGTAQGLLWSYYLIAARNTQDYGILMVPILLTVCGLALGLFGCVYDDKERPEQPSHGV